MKKTITAILALAFLMSCTAAFAGDTQPANSRGEKFAHGHHHMHKMAMSPETKAEFDKLCTLEKKLHEEMKKETPDKTEAMSLKSKIEDIRSEMSQKKFEKMLADPNFGKHSSKLSETAKMRIKKMHQLKTALKEELMKDNPDKSAALQLNSEILKLKKEASLERFEKRLDNPKKFSKGHHGFGKRHGHRRMHGYKGCMKQHREFKKF